MFPQESFPDTFAPLNWIEAIQQVLVPEAGSLLVMEDMNVGPEEAVQILIDSHSYGLQAHPYKDPPSPVVKQEPAEPLLIVDREIIDLTL